MRNKFIIRLATVVRRFFYTFLDMTGILLGVFLISLGIWIVLGWEIGVAMGYFILFLGIVAFFIHTGHYFHLTIARLIFGQDTYFYKDSTLLKDRDIEMQKTDSRPK